MKHSFILLSMMSLFLLTADFNSDGNLLEQAIDKKINQKSGECENCQNKDMVLPSFGVQLLGWTTSASVQVNPDDLEDMMQAFEDATMLSELPELRQPLVSPAMVGELLDALADGLRRRRPAIWVQVEVKCCIDQHCEWLQWGKQITPCTHWLQVINPSINQNIWPPIDDWADQTYSQINNAIEDAVENFNDSLTDADDQLTECPCQG